MKDVNKGIYLDRDNVSKIAKGVSKPEHSCLSDIRKIIYNFF